MEVAAAGPSLIRLLASCDKATRDKALATLVKNWLPNQSEISDDDMKKLWKGLFYCVWHADKLPVQTQLIDQISSVLPTLDVPLSLHYFSVFLLTMRREWTSIDGLRLDKFYLLIRRFLHCYFLILKNNSWDLELTRRLMSLLVDKTFLAEDKFQGNGVLYHIASVFLEELRPFLPVRKEVVEVVLMPFVSVMGTVANKVLVGKIKSNVFEELVKVGNKLLEVKKSGVDIDKGDDAVVLGSIALVMGFSARFYELGSLSNCCQGNRKTLFGLHEKFLKLEKDLASSGIEISIPEVTGDEEDEVPTLIPSVDEKEGFAAKPANGNGNSDKALKKCVKVKKTSGGAEKKGKKGKKSVSDDPEDTLMDGNHNSIVVANGENSKKEGNSNGNLLTFDENVISNLQVKFEKVASEGGLKSNMASVCNETEAVGNGAGSKKRKRGKKMDSQGSQNMDLAVGEEDAEASATAKGGENSVKRVKFSMKNNLVWKPHNPLPPQSLRLPPSVTPRGSALKKGVPPGPIREMPPPTKKVKQKTKSPKKARKAIKSISFVVKKYKKLKSLTPS